jgi:alkylhydroperoxidase/carboxymuconolactone decarboxylase family protein YurZ
MSLTFAQLASLERNTPVIVTTHFSHGETTQRKGVMRWCNREQLSIACAIQKGVHSALQLQNWMEKNGIFEEFKGGRRWTVDLDSSPLSLESYSYQK